MYKIMKSSDSTTNSQLYTTDCSDVLQWAQTHGRAETGEIIWLYAEDDLVHPLACCYWDNIHSTYRRYCP